mgnify:FL=1
MLYPKGSKGDDSLSIYVEVADESKLPENWSYLANFSFVVVNQLTGDKKISREGELLHIILASTLKTKLLFSRGA